MDIKKINFEAKKYLVWKKSINIADLTDRAMYDQGFGKLISYVQENKVEVVGAGAVLYLTWDEVNQKTDIALAFPVKVVEAVNDEELGLMDVPDSKALMAEVKGSYDGLKDAHHEVMQEIVAGKLENWLAIEEYVTNPATTETKDLITKVYYLYR